MPLYLEMQGFGPYREAQKIDFARLRQAGLFLICGVTGAGKTAILDAMTYALYGASSGGQRGDLLKMRCQLSEREENTRILFLFEHKGKTYGFQRELRAKRTSGFHESILCGPWAEGGIQPFAANIGAKNTAKYAEELLGLTADQFRQVIILPQGKFERLLTANTAEKEAILSTLFGTEIWNRTAELVKEQAAEARRALEAREKLLRSTLERLGAESFPELLARKETLGSSLGGMQEQTEQARRALALWQERETVGKMQAQRFDDWEGCRRNLQALEEQRPEMERAGEALALHQRTERVMPALREQTRAEEALAQRERETEEARQAWKRAEEALEASRQQYAGLEAAREEAARLTRQRDKLREDAAVLEQVWQLQEEIRRQEEAAKRASRQDWTARIGQLEEKRRALAQERESLLEAFRQEEPARKRLEELEAAAQLWDEMARLEQEGRRLRTQWEQAAEQWRAAKDAAEKARVAYDEGHARHFADLAGTLRATLQEGDICPVCGGVVHETPQEGPSGETIDLERLQRAYMAGQEQAGERQAASVQLEERLKGAQNTYRLQRERLRALTGEGAFRRDMLKEAQAAWQQCQQGRQRFEQAGRQLEKLEKELAEAKERKEAQDQETEALERELLRLREREQTQREKVEHICPRAELETLRKQTEAALEQKQRWIKDTEEQYHQNVQEEATTASLWREREKERQAAAAQAAAAGQRTAEALEAAGLESRAQAEQGRLTEQAAAELGQSLQEWSQSLDLERRTMKRLEAELEGVERPDLERLARGRQEAQEAYDARIAESQRAAYELEQLERECAAAEKEYEEIQRERPAVERKTGFAALLSGNVRVSLGRYVMGVMLSAVTAEANKLLQNVHGGRYKIFRAGEDSEKKSSKTGLAIEVYDGYSGGTRGAASLSGGEKFLVSMALSLGLAAVMQAVAGGIAIDSMFIDEGFGTLDEASMNDALDMLATVKESGRMVGIISHVGGLRETIGCALEVRKAEGRRGSSILLRG